MLLNIIEHTQDQPTTLLLDLLGYQHNDRTTQTWSKHYIALFRIPPNSSAWLQPCDVVLFGSAKQKVRK